MTNSKREQKALAKARGWTRDIKECVGVGLGPKIIGGVDTGRRAVVVLVDEKRPLGSVVKAVPLSVGGVETDVVETGGPFRALGLAALPQADAVYGRRFDRPVPCGVSLGHHRITAGTLGALGRCRATNKRVVLTNYHVASPAGHTRRDGGFAREGDPILQPGPADGGTPDGDLLGRLLSYQPIRFDAGARAAEAESLWARWLAWVRRLFRRPEPPAPNTGDLALVEVLEGHVAAGLPTDVPGGLDPATQPAVWADVQPGDEAIKVGRTTGLTRGECRYTQMRVTVDYGPAGPATHEDQDVYTDMCEGGDSGSLVMDPTQQEALGLLYAGSPRFMIAMPWRYVRPHFVLEGEEG